MKDKFIFDLDYTLYTIHDHIDTEDEHLYYSSFKKKPFMNHLLSKLKNKYIITNGTRSHALEIVKKMDLKHFFSKKNILSRDDMKGTMKPDVIPYIIANNKFKLKPHDNVYFFEDMVENLVTAKRFLGWNTVLISSEIVDIPSGVDYVFETIENALQYLISKKNLMLKNNIK